MLVVKIEIWPGGHEELKREIRRILVWNTSYLRPISNYGIQVINTEQNSSSIVYKGEVKRHKRDLGAMKLLQRVFNKINRGN